MYPKFHPATLKQLVVALGGEMMLPLKPQRVHLAFGSTDMRTAINGAPNGGNASLVPDAQEAPAKAPSELGSFKPSRENVDSITLSLAPISKCRIFTTTPRDRSPVQ